MTIGEATRFKILYTTCYITDKTIRWDAIKPNEYNDYHSQQQIIFDP